MVGRKNLRNLLLKILQSTITATPIKNGGEYPEMRGGVGSGSEESSPAGSPRSCKLPSSRMAGRWPGSLISADKARPWTSAAMPSSTSPGVRSQTGNWPRSPQEQGHSSSSRRASTRQQTWAALPTDPHGCRRSGQPHPELSCARRPLSHPPHLRLRCNCGLLEAARKAG